MAKAKRTPMLPISTAMLVISVPVMTAASASGSSEVATTPLPALHNGAFDEGVVGWYPSNLPDAVEMSVVDVSGDRKLNMRVTESEGSLAQDLAITDASSHTYSQTIRASSPSGLPVLVELALHGLVGESDTGESSTRVVTGESSTRLVMVEGYEVPITVSLAPTVDYSALRTEISVHTVGRDVQIDDAELLVDGKHYGANNFGYQQPRVRYLDDVDASKLEPGGTYRVEITVGTTSDQPWTCCNGIGPVRLGAEDGDSIDGSDRESVLFVEPAVDGSSWANPGRINMAEAVVDQDGKRYGAMFTTLIKAPATPGVFAEAFRVVADGVTWMPGPIIEIIGSVVAPETETEPPAPPGSQVGQPETPETPDLPETPDVPATPEVPETPETPELPESPQIPPTPELPEIQGVDLEVTQVAPGAIDVSWSAPETLEDQPVTTDETVHYLVDLWSDTDAQPPTGEPSQRFVVSKPGLTIEDLQPGNYAVEVAAISSTGRWQRWTDVGVEVQSEQPPITEVPVPPIERCPTPAGVEEVSPGLCVPEPIIAPGCEPVQVRFARPSLMGFGGWDRTELVAVDLTCSVYQIVLRSVDDQHAAGYQTDQTDESWYLEGLDADGHVVYVSPPTPDLADDETEASVALDAVQLDDVVSFRARHTRRHDGANSIEVEADLIPIG